jgi:hypothetical protein
MQHFGTFKVHRNTLWAKWASRLLCRALQKRLFEEAKKPIRLQDGIGCKLGFKAINFLIHAWVFPCPVSVARQLYWGNYVTLVYFYPHSQSYFLLLSPMQQILIIQHSSPVDLFLHVWRINNICCLGASTNISPLLCSRCLFNSFF